MWLPQLHPNLRGGRSSVCADQKRVDVADECLSIPEEPLLGCSQKGLISNQTSGTGAHAHTRARLHTQLGHMANLPSSAVLFPAQ